MLAVIIGCAKGLYRSKTLSDGADKGSTMGGRVVEAEGEKLKEPKS